MMRVDGWRIAVTEEDAVAGKRRTPLASSASRVLSVTYVSRENYLLASSVRSSSAELSRIFDGRTFKLNSGFALHRDIPAQRNRSVACVCI